MANYYGSTRTNYFKVTDGDAFVKLIEKCATDDPEGISVWTNEAKDGTTLYGFGCYGDIDGIDTGDDEDYPDYNYDEFIGELQKLLPEGEAVIITHVGQEKLRYLCGSVTVATKDKVEYRYLSKIGADLAKEMLGNPEWNTKNEY